jgi:hypothetical protein
MLRRTKILQLCYDEDALEGLQVYNLMVIQFVHFLDSRGSFIFLDTNLNAKVVIMIVIFL